MRSTMRVDLVRGDLLSGPGHPCILRVPFIAIRDYAGLWRVAITPALIEMDGGRDAWLKFSIDFAIQSSLR